MNRNTLTLIHTLPASRAHSLLRTPDAHSVFTLIPAQSSPDRSHIAGLDYDGRRRAGQSGSDFVDIIPRGGSTLAVCMGSSFAPGPDSSLMISGLQNLLCGLTANAEVGPASIVAALNRSVCGAPGDDSIATLFYAWVDSVRSELCYVNAGHEPALLLRKRQSRAITLESTGAVLGLTHRSTYGQRTIPLEPGDLLAVFSEGVAESADILGRPFGSTGVLSALRHAEPARAATLVQEILDAAERHAGWGVPSGDQTVAVVRLTGGMEEAVPAEAEEALVFAAARAS